MRTLLSLLLLVGISSTASAQTIQRIDVTEVGIFRTETTAVEAAPGTATGRVQKVINRKLVRATTTIPARLGVNFGIQYDIVGRAGASATLKVVWLIPQPGIRNPKTGNTTVRDVFDRSSIVGSTNNFSGFSFTHAWEIVTGTWAVEIWDGNRKLASQSFNVVTP